MYGCVCGRALAKNITGRETKELEEERSSIGAYILPMIIVMIRLAERFSSSSFFFFFELLAVTRPLLNAKSGAKKQLIKDIKKKLNALLFRNMLFVFLFCLLLFLFPATGPRFGPVAGKRTHKPVHTYTLAHTHTEKKKREWQIYIYIYIYIYLFIFIDR